MSGRRWRQAGSEVAGPGACSNSSTSAAAGRRVLFAAGFSLGGACSRSAWSARAASGSGRCAWAQVLVAAPGLLPRHGGAAGAWARSRGAPSLGGVGCARGALLGAARLARGRSAQLGLAAVGRCRSCSGYFGWCRGCGTGYGGERAALAGLLAGGAPWARLLASWVPDCTLLQLHGAGGQHWCTALYALDARVPRAGGARALSARS